MLASFKGHTAIVQLLLEMGADTESNNAVRETKRKNHTHLHMWLTRWFGEYTPCDLFQSLWLRLVHVRPGAWPERRCFFCLKVVWQSVLGCQMQEENVFLFLFDTLFLLKESWESTEELRVRSSVLKNWKKKKRGGKMKIFVASALFSIVAWIMSDENSETCIEITKVDFRAEVSSEV